MADMSVQDATTRTTGVKMTIKPCPFCGCTNLHMIDDLIICMDCETRSPVSTWSARVEPSKYAIALEMSKEYNRQSCHTSLYAFDGWLLGKIYKEPK